MNYALDALWWRLNHPQVRALAAVLTAPPLWKTGCELPVSMLLGAEGFRLLLRWNDVDEALPEVHPQQAVGRYAQELLVFWLNHAPHTRLLAVDVPVYGHDGRTLGAFDCVACIGDVVCHIELCCKYVGAEHGQPQQMRGFNQNDGLWHKIQHVPRQLMLSHTPEGQACLRRLGLNPHAVRRVSLVRGMGFTASTQLPEHRIYAANAWTGQWRHQTEGLPPLTDGGQWRLLTKNQWLAPARLDWVDGTVPDRPPAGLWAHLVQREDGHWHEQTRLMLAA